MISFANLLWLHSYCLFLLPDFLFLYPGAAAGPAVFGQKHKNCFLQVLLIFKPFPVFPLQPNPPPLAGTEIQTHPVQSTEKFCNLRRAGMIATIFHYLLSERQLGFPVRGSFSKSRSTELHILIPASFT